MGLWFGALARPRIRRSALVIDASGSHELTAPEDSDDVETGELGDFIYEPDGAVIRARLIGDLARSLGARMLSDGIAYLTSSTLVATPFASAFRVLETLPTPQGSRNMGLDIKKRGVDFDPAALRKRLSLSGRESATLVLTRIAGRHTALLVDRVG